MLDARKNRTAVAPTAGRQVPIPQHLAQHRPILPYHDSGDFADRLDAVQRAAAALIREAPGEPDRLSTGHQMRLIPPVTDPSAPKGGRHAPMPHRPILPHHDGGDFADRLDAVQRGAAALIRDPVRDVAVALQGLTHEQKRQVATTLRTTVMRLNTWASLMLEARR